MLNKLPRILLLLIIIVIVAEALYLFLPSGNIGFLKEAFRKETKVLVGKDFIGISREKAIELLNQPENKGKMIFCFTPNKNTKIVFYPSSDKRFLGMTLIGLPTSNIYVPTDGEFSVGETVDYPIGIIAFNNIKVYFGLSDEEKLNLDVGGKSGSLGKYVYGHATKLDLFKDHRELGSIYIEAVIREEGKQVIEEVEQYFKKTFLMLGNRYVFLK